jgi:hypothetical protein
MEGEIPTHEHREYEQHCSFLSFSCVCFETPQQPLVTRASKGSGEMGQVIFAMDSTTVRRGRPKPIRVQQLGQPFLTMKVFLSITILKESEETETSPAKFRKITPRRHLSMSTESRGTIKSLAPVEVDAPSLSMMSSREGRCFCRVNCAWMRSCPRAGHGNGCRSVIKGECPLPTLFPERCRGRVDQ